MTMERNSPTQMEVRVLLANSTRKMREGMAGILRSADFEIVADVENEADLVRVSTGATNEEIAQKLIITKNTVKVHLRHILERLDLRNRQQIAAYAVREGVAEDGRDIEKEPQFVRRSLDKAKSYLRSRNL